MTEYERASLTLLALIARGINLLVQQDFMDKEDRLKAAHSYDSDLASAVNDIATERERRSRG